MRIQLACIKSGCTYERDLVNIEEEQLSYKIPKNHIKTKGKFSAGDQSTSLDIYVKNVTDKPLVTEAKLPSRDNWQIEQKSFSLNLQPEEIFRKKVNITLLKAYFPLPKLKLTYPFGREKQINYEESVNLTKEIKVPQLSTSPEIDGIITKNISEKFIEINDFCSYKGEKSDISPTQVYLGHSEKNLFLTIKAAEEEIAKIKINNSQRDSEVYKDDSIGILFSTTPDLLYQSYFNLNNTIWDLKTNLKTYQSDENWNCDYQTAVKKYDDKWIMEIKIPLHKFDFKQENSINLNLTRRQTTKSEQGFLSPNWNYNTGQYLHLILE